MQRIRLTETAAFLQQALPVRLWSRGGQGQCLLRPERMCIPVKWSLIQANSAQAINKRIKELNFKDTKVRVTNVDSQGSDANIVIQVIGEISNQGQPHQRFVQTFVLAEQTNGYFVLNDIFRYLADEPEEEDGQQESAAPANGVTEPAPTAAVPADTDGKESDEIATSEEDLNKADEKLHEAAQEEPSVEEAAPAAPTQQVPEEVEQPAAEEAPAAAEEKANDEPEAAPEETTEPEKPAASTQTPAPAAQKAAPAAMPSGPPKPAAPRTWASLAASAAKVATPVVNAPASQQAPSQPKAAAPAQPAAAAAPSQTPAPARDGSPAPSQGEAAGWQTATGHKKEQSRAQNPGPAADPDQKRAYLKNVYSQVDDAALKAALTKFGDVEHIDISRGKVCDILSSITQATNFLVELRFRRLQDPRWLPSCCRCQPTHD
jgi:hypothetical protein